MMKLVSVNVGLPRDVTWQGRTVTTGIFKAPIDGPVPLRRHNLEGDRQADLSVHGGPTKAVYVYPTRHYDVARKSDEDNTYYRQYGIEHSVAGMFKGMFLRMPTLLRAMSKGYVPTTIKGSMTTIPADFLIDREGIIQVAHYGRDEGDHLPFDTVKQFSHG